MSTPNTSTPRPYPSNPTSKPTPRSTTALTPASASASSPSASATASGPRSVPSPAYLYPSSNTKAGKSPYKHPLNGTGTPTPRSDGSIAGAGGVGSSPAAGALSGVAGAGLDARRRAESQGSRSVTGSEVGVGTPAFSAASLGMGLVGFGGHSMVRDGSLTDETGGMGLSTLGAGLHVRDNEEERKRRIEGIVHVLGKKWGRVSQEGVERCARRLGLECLWEDGANANTGARMLSIAGHGIDIEIEFVKEDVRGVTLGYPGSGEGAGRSTNEGAELLKADLVRSNHRIGYVMLDAFADNLERLARMDRLGKEGVSCIDAIEGVNGCLKRLFAWECEKARESYGDDGDDGNVAREVLCKRSGVPEVHAMGKIGLRLEYWMERRLVPVRKRKADEMDIDVDIHQPNPAKFKKNLSTMMIECQASSAQLYPSIRISDLWISEAIETPTLVDDDLFASSEPTIDWQEPPLTFVSPSENNGDAMQIDSEPLLQARSPNVRFVARLEPPIVVPLQTAVEIHNLVASPIPQESIQSTTYESLLFPNSSKISTAGEATEGSFHVERSVRTYASDGTFNQHLHVNTLFTGKSDFARTLHEIPFSHPRQLVTILPNLRQWVLVASILRRSFGSDDDSYDAEKKLPRLAQINGKDQNTSNCNSSKIIHINGSSPTSQALNPLLLDTSDEDSDSDADDNNAVPSFLSSTLPTTSRLPEQPLHIDISLSLQPVPRIMLTFGVSSSTRNIAFEIHPNGEIEAVDLQWSEGGRDGGAGVNLEEKDEAEGSALEEEMRKVAKVLSIGEDLGIVVEWMRGRDER